MEHPMNKKVPTPTPRQIKESMKAQTRSDHGAGKHQSKQVKPNQPCQS
jgi:hypothetical protein